jgi:hypothetical protein
MEDAENTRIIMKIITLYFGGNIMNTIKKAVETMNLFVIASVIVVAVGLTVSLYRTGKNEEEVEEKDTKDNLVFEDDEI